MKNQLMSIKAKKLGVRLAGFRQKKGVSVDALSQWTGISKEELEKFEKGESSPSLSLIELMAMKLGLEAEMLLFGELENPQLTEATHKFNDQYTAIRNRTISLNLQLSRSELNKSLESVAKNCGITPEELEQYESGRTSIPLPILECLCDEYHFTVSSLLTTMPDSKTPPGPKLDNAVESNQLPDELSEFIKNPSNLPYLELAKKLSELDATKLRNIAEGLLEITY